MLANAFGRVHQLLSPEDIDAGEHAGRRRVPDPDDLRGLALAAVRRPEHLERRGVADGREAAPERGRDAAVVRILDHARQFPVRDQEAALAAELELVARVVDRPRGVRLHEHAALDARDELAERLVARLDVEVRHSVDRRPVPAVGARVRDAGEPGALLRDRAAERTLEDAVADQNVRSAGVPSSS
jgi:hypothetical protein